MNNYITVRDVLDAARRFHQRLTKFYDRLTRSEDRERLRVLLDGIRRHEDYFARSLERYDDQGRKRLLGTWLQFGPKSDALDLPMNRDITGEMSLDDVQDLALQFDDALASFYAETARLVQSNQVRDLFRNLVQQHEADKATIRMNVEGVKKNM